MKNSSEQPLVCLTAFMQAMGSANISGRKLPGRQYCWLNTGMYGNVVVVDELDEVLEEEDVELVVVVRLVEEVVVKELEVEEVELVVVV